MDNVMVTAACRFCGQLVQMEFEREPTEPQAQEAATMRCDCSEAAGYRLEVLRKTKARKNVVRLFGEGAEGTKVNDSAGTLLLVAVEEICNGNIRKIAMELPGGIKAVISQGKKGEVNVERIEIKKQKLTE